MAQITGRIRGGAGRGLVKELGLRSFAHTAFRYTNSFFFSKTEKALLGENESEHLLISQSHGRLDQGSVETH